MFLFAGATGYALAQTAAPPPLPQQAPAVQAQQPDTAPATQRVLPPPLDAQPVPVQPGTQGAAVSIPPPTLPLPTQQTTPPLTVQQGGPQVTVRQAPLPLQQPLLSGFQSAPRTGQQTVPPLPGLQAAPALPVTQIAPTLQTAPAPPGLQSAPRPSALQVAPPLPGLQAAPVRSGLQSAPQPSGGAPAGGQGAPVPVVQQPITPPPGLQGTTGTAAQQPVLTVPVPVPQPTPPALVQAPAAPQPAPAAAPADTAAQPASGGTSSAASEVAATKTGPAGSETSPFSPDADVLIETEILPVLDRFADRAVALQNAVLRHCLVGRPVSQAALEPIFVMTVQASAALLPLSFGSEEAHNAPTRLLTRASSTAFASSRLEAVMLGQSPAPRTLGALAQEEAALLGLPALEHLLLRRRYPNELRLEHRCRLAVPVAANIVDTAVRTRQRWLNRNVDEHWQGDTVELAGRLRLRDLIQGAIDAVDRIGFDLTEFQRQPRDNNAGRFAQVRHGLPYLIAATDALRQHMHRLEKFVEPSSRTAALLAEIAKALAISCERLMALAQGADADGSYLVAFEQAHGDIINDLPESFGFDATAFDRALSSFEVTTRTTETQKQ